MSKQYLKTEIEALVCYNEFDGECTDKDGTFLIICNRPDDTGCLCDNGDEEVYVKLNDLYVDTDKYTKIQELAKNYH